MNADQERRRTDRQPCAITAKIAIYVPLEYENYFGPGCFSAKIINYTETGLGLISEGVLSQGMIVCVTPEFEKDGTSGILSHRSYQSAIRWVRKGSHPVDESVAIGVQHIR